MEIDAFILIGGRSSRFGENKANFEFDGITLAERSLQTVADAIKPASTRFVAGIADQTHQFVRLHSDVSVIFDIYPGCGAAGALHSALSHTRSEWIFVLACDLPFVSVDVIRLLAEQLSAELDAVVPVQADGAVQPLCAFYRVEAFRGLLDELVKSDKKLPSLKEIVQSKRAQLLSFEKISSLSNSVNLFLNLNTPEDLRKAEEVIRN